MKNLTSAAETSLTVAAKRLWYWTFGGIWQCGKIAFDLRHMAAFEFVTSGFLLVIGVWLLIPNSAAYGMAFALVIMHKMPLWIFAALCITVARVGIHLTLKGSDASRSLGLVAVAFLWSIMTWMNLLAGSIEVGTPIFAIAALFTIAVQLRMDAKICAAKRVVDRQRELLWESHILE